ncbi:phasin family protein [Hyphococcus sp.]|uniref:phasin family protein n=1 Tax=Hyphococcus sp. TaxID=2038636 RepID=UPI003CCC2B6C
MATTTKTAAKKTAAKKATAEKKMTDAATDWMSISGGSEWADVAKEQFETMLRSFGGDFEEMRAQAEELSEEMQTRFKSTQERASENQARLMEAAQEEVSGAVQLANELTTAKSFVEALNIQQSYWTKLFETRMERARELTEATVETARETMTPVEMPFANFKAFEKFFVYPAKA